MARAEFTKYANQMTCSAEHCVRPARGRSPIGPLCGMHRQRFKKQGSTQLATKTTKPLPTCKACKRVISSHHGRMRHQRRGYGFCSMKCSSTQHTEKALKTTKIRFFSRLDLQPNECHVWNGQKNKTGYGLFSINGISRLAHRVAWQFANGPIPLGKLVCHSCDNPPCCNPDHLWIGTAADNTADMWSKGRAKVFARRGSSVNTAKLNAEKVAIIRASKLKAKDLAKSFGVTAVQIYNIRSGRQWRHV
jgi:HNH endonuclease